SFFFSSRRRHTIFSRDWSSDVCSSDLQLVLRQGGQHLVGSALNLIDPCVAGLLVLFQSWRQKTNDDARSNLHLTTANGDELFLRSEERRVGKERRAQTWRSY